MGRRKIEIQPIDDDRNRSVTFIKRKAGLLKKAHELSVLCKVDVAVIILGSNNTFYEFSSTDMNKLLNCYLNSIDNNNLNHIKKFPKDYGDNFNSNSFILDNLPDSFTKPANNNNKRNFIDDSNTNVSKKQHVKSDSTSSSSNLYKSNSSTSVLNSPSNSNLTLLQPNSFSNQRKLSMRPVLRVQIPNQNTNSNNTNNNSSSSTTNNNTNNDPNTNTANTNSKTRSLNSANGFGLPPVFPYSPSNQQQFYLATPFQQHPNTLPQPQSATTSAIRSQTPLISSNTNTNTSNDKSNLINQNINTTNISTDSSSTSSNINNSNSPNNTNSSISTNTNTNTNANTNTNNNNNNNQTLPNSVNPNSAGGPLTGNLPSKFVHDLIIPSPNTNMLFQDWSFNNNNNTNTTTKLLNRHTIEINTNSSSTNINNSNLNTSTGLTPYQTSSSASSNKYFTFVNDTPTTTNPPPLLGNRLINNDNNINQSNNQHLNLNSTTSSLRKDILKSENDQSISSSSNKL